MELVFPSDLELAAEIVDHHEEETFSSAGYGYVRTAGVVEEEE